MGDGERKKEREIGREREEGDKEGGRQQKGY